jgi:hypothetical protein
MSWKALFRPAGRRGARVYWRRRLLAVGFLFVAVLAGVWAVARHGAPRPPGAPVYAVASPIQPAVSPSVPGSAAAAAPPVAPDGADTAGPGAQPSTPPQAQDAGQPTTSAGPDQTATAGVAPATCQDRDITVRVSPSALRVTQGGDVSFVLVVSARGLDCDVAGLTRTVQVANSAGPVWSSSRCGYPPTGPTVVRPGAPVTSQVTWNTRACGLGNTGPVASGAYDVIGRAGGVSGFGGTLTVS